MWIPILKGLKHLNTVLQEDQNLELSANRGQILGERNGEVKSGRGIWERKLGEDGN